MTNIRHWLIAGLGTLTTVVGVSSGQVTLSPSSYVESKARSPSGTVDTGHILPVFNGTPLQALAISGASTALADGTFISSPGYALMRLDLDHGRDEANNSIASTIAVLILTLSESMAYELTGEYVYLGNEAAYYEYNLQSTFCIYCGVQLMSSSTTATVGTLPLGQQPGGPTSGVLAAGTYIVVWDSNVYANLGNDFASATGFFQLQLGELPCPEDLNNDTQVNVTDLLNLLGAWGPNPGHVADFTGPGDVPDGDVNVTDLLALLAAWGACP